MLAMRLAILVKGFLKLEKFLYLFLVVAIQAYGQLVMKWQIDKLGHMPNNLLDQGRIVVGLLINPWVFSFILMAFFSFILYVLALRQFQLSYAFPVTISLTLVAVLSFRHFFWGEALGMNRIIGILLIIGGVFLAG